MNCKERSKIEMRNARDLDADRVRAFGRLLNYARKKRPSDGSRFLEAHEVRDLRLSLEEVEQLGEMARRLIHLEGWHDD